jgi:hypothetical protein
MAGVGVSAGLVQGVLYTGASTDRYDGTHAYLVAGGSYELTSGSSMTQGSMLGAPALAEGRGPRGLAFGLGLGADRVRGTIATVTSASRPLFGLGETKYSGCQWFDNEGG